MSAVTNLFTEMALESPNAAGDFGTVGANRDASAAVKEGDAC